MVLIPTYPRQFNYFDRQPRHASGPTNTLTAGWPYYRPNISGGMVPRGDWAVGKANGEQGADEPFINREAGSLDALYPLS